MRLYHLMLWRAYHVKHRFVQDTRQSLERPRRPVSRKSRKFIDIVNVAKDSWNKMGETKSKQQVGDLPEKIMMGGFVKSSF